MKRILAMLLAVALVASCLPVSVLAEGSQPAHIHCECGKEVTLDATCESCGTKAVTWTGVNGLPGGNGHYYLTENISAELVEYGPGAEISICLHGQNITSTNGERILTAAAGGAKVIITDCAENQGAITGGTTNKYGSALRVNYGSTLTMYGGRITGNTAPSTGDGTVYVGEGTATQVGGTFIMYGGEITGNTARRGSGVFLANPGTTKKPGAAYILGGSITGNTGKGTGGTKGGAGILAFGTVVIGGKAVITGNTAAEGPADIYLRDSGYPGALTVSADVPLENGASINFGSDTATLAALSGNPAQWNCHWLTMDGQNVSFANGGFVLGHYHGDQEYQPISGNAAVRDFTGFGYLTTNLNLGGPQTWKVNKTLCLNGHNIKAKAGNRVFSTENASPVTIVIQDCSADTDENGNYIAGKLYGGENTSGGGGAFNVAVGSKIYLQDGIITENKSAVAAGAILVNGEFYMEGGLIANNQAKNGETLKNGAAIQLNSDAKISISGGTITGHTAAKGAAIYCNGSNSVYEFTGGTITGNTSAEGGAVFAGANVTVKLGGKPVITGNKMGEKEANLYLAGTNTMQVDVLEAGAKIGISAEAANRAITGACGDYSTQIISDDPEQTVFHEDGALQLGTPITHIHSLCNETGCTDHEAVGFAPWKSTNTLPESGDYYLTGDVELTKQATLDSSKVNLCLNGHTVRVKDGAQIRFFYLKGDSQLNITDCNANPGTMTGATKSAIMTENVEDSAPVFNLWNGFITGNRGESGGGAVMLQGKATFNMYGGALTNNAVAGALGGGAVSQYSKTATFNMYGGEISGNSVTQTDEGKGGVGGGAYIRGNFNMYGGIITGNTAEVLGGGVYLDSSAKDVQLSGTVTLTGNSTGNLHAAGTQLLQIENLAETSAVGVSGFVAYSTISGPCADYTAQVTSDLSDHQVIYKDGALYLDGPATHSHCLCAAAVTGCDHQSVKFAPWNSTDSLPTTGNYYLTADVELTKQATMESGNVNLCLNGFTVKVKDGAQIRFFYLKGDSQLNITDCNANPGTMTGATKSAIMTENVEDSAPVFNLWNGCITGNRGESGGGAVMLQGKATFNMYGGALTNNTVAGTLGGGAVSQYSKTATFNMYGGEISGNSAIQTTDGKGGVGGAVYVRGIFQMFGGQLTGNASDRLGGAVMGDGIDAVITVAGGVIAENESKAGGAVMLQSKAQMTLSGGEIRGNKASSGGAGIYVGTDSSFTMTGGMICGNISEKSGGGLYVLRTAATISGGSVCDNKAGTTGGGIYNCSGDLTVTGGLISGNHAGTHGGGISLAATTVNEKEIPPTLALQGGEITGNTADGMGGGIYIPGNAKETTLSGTPVVSDNTAGGKTSNLFLNGQQVLTVGAMAAPAKVGISAAQAFRSVSQQLEADQSSYFFSDDSALTVIYQDKTLYLDTASTHIHCACNGDNKNCDHAAIKFAPWEATDSLPTSGNYYLTADVVLTKEISVVKNLNLCLNGFTVKAAENKRILSTPKDAGVALMITDCAKEAGQLTGGVDMTTTGAGAIFIRSGNSFRLFNGKICGNTSITAGGAIVISSDAKLEIHGGEISGNSAKAEGKTKNGGGVFLNAGAQCVMTGGLISGNEGALGGGFYANSAKLTVTGGEILSNKANMGGGIYATGTAEVTFTDGVIGGNTAAGNGGGIYMATGTLLTMTGGTIRNNTSDTNGGGIYILKQNVTVSGIIEGNTALCGGGIYSNGAELTLTDLTIKGNKADEGAGIYANTPGNGTENAVPAVVVVDKNTEISGNRATKNGGGILVSGTNAKLTVTGGKITGNSSKNAGGILMLGSSFMTMSGGSVSGNTANSGGGIYISSNSNLTMTGGSVSGNTATKNAGGIYLLRCTATFQGGTITGNSGEGGGGIYAAGAKATISGTTVSNNQAVKNGGALMMLNSSLTKDGVKTLYGCTVEMIGGSFSGNRAINAGGVLVQGTSAVFRLKGGSITGNHATSTGGGVYVSTNGTMEMTGGSVSGNSTDKYGGGIWVNKGTATLEAGAVSGNTVPTSGGGVVAANNSTVYLGKGLKVSENSAKAAAGLLCQGKAVLTVEGTEVSGNVSTTLGAGLYVSTNSKTIVKDAYFHDNRSESNGGGMYCNQNAFLEVEGTRIENNKAVAGAGLFNRGNTTIKGCTVTGNQSEGDGAGLGTYKMAFNGGLHVEDSVISDNASGGRGGGIFFSLGCFGSVKNVTMEGNTAAAEGGALWAKDELLIHSLTATGNTSGGEGYAVYLADSDYDGESYIAGAMKMGGSVIVKDNQGGDMYLGEQTTIAIPGGVIGENTHIEITIASGLLTQKVFGQYNYEGGDQVYTITYGDRSITDPELVEVPEETQPTQQETTPTQPAEQPQTPAEDNSGLYLGIGGIGAVILVAAVLLVIVKKKKTAKGSSKE